MHATRLTIGVSFVHAGNSGPIMGRHPSHLRATRRAISALATVGTPRSMHRGTIPLPHTTEAALQRGKTMMLRAWITPEILIPIRSGTAWIEGPGGVELKWIMLFTALAVELGSNVQCKCRPAS